MTVIPSVELFEGFSIGLSIKTISFLMFSILAIAAVGYMLGRITIKGVSLGTGGVFIIALIFGVVFYQTLSAQFTTYKQLPVDEPTMQAIQMLQEDKDDAGNAIAPVTYEEIDLNGAKALSISHANIKEAMPLISAGGYAVQDDGVTVTVTDSTLISEMKVLLGQLDNTVVATDDSGATTAKVATDNTSNMLKAIENLGLILFVTSVGFIAGPKFFGNLKKNFKSYIMIGLIIILAGALTCVGCIYIDQWLNPDRETGEIAAMLVGLLSGSLTSTPAFSAAKDTVIADYEGLVSVGHGIAYLFGVIGVVLFVQLIPKISKADMEAERAKITAVAAADEKKYNGKLIEMDEFGFMPFALAAAIGIFVGSLKIGNFSLTTTGGCLLASLIFGHFSRIGKISLMPSVKVLKVFRELGLMLFLIGAGIAGGAEFIAEFEAIYFVYGVIMTIVPMFIGFFFAKFVLKLPLLNNLGSITGGMTSTPALGTLINVSGTEDVASAYAATYPFSLIAVVVASQVIILLFS